MAGDVQFLGELEAFLAGLDWVEVRYARIAAGGAVDLGVTTDQRARLHVDLVERFGAGRVNVVAVAPEVEPRELDVQGWSVDQTGQQLTLHVVTGGSTPSSHPYVELLDAGGAIELRLWALPSPPGSLPASAAGYPTEIRVALASPIGDRDVRHASGRLLAPYRVDGDDVINLGSGQLAYRGRPQPVDAPVVSPS